MFMTPVPITRCNLAFIQNEAYGKHCGILGERSGAQYIVPPPTDQNFIVGSNTASTFHRNLRYYTMTNHALAL